MGIGSGAGGSSYNAVAEGLREVAGDLFINSFAKRTLATYRRNWEEFIGFLDSVNLPLILEDGILDIFIAHLHLKGLQVSTIKSKLSSVSAVLKANGIDKNFYSYRLRHILIGAGKLKSPIKPRLPISSEILVRMVQVLPSLQLGYWDTVLYSSMFVLAYVGCFRVSELIPSDHVDHAVRAEFMSLLCKDKEIVALSIQLLSYKFSSDYIPAIHLYKYKQLNLRDICTVRWLLQYLTLRGRSPGYLFTLQHGSPPSRDLFSKVVKLSVAALGLNPDLFDTHSFRIGRCSEWVEMGVSPAQIMSWGRWKSEAYTKYVKPFILIPAPPASL